MANNTWSAVGADNWSTDAAWSLGHKPQAGEDVIFDATSVQNCTVDEASAALGSFTLAVGYMGTFDDGGFAFTVAGAVSITPGGTFTASGTWTQTVDANFTLADSGTPTISSMSLVVQGSGTVAINPPYRRFANFTCGAPGKTTIWGGAGAGIGVSGTGALTVGTGTLQLSGWFERTVTGTCTPIVCGGLITGPAGINLELRTGGDSAINIGALNMTARLQITKRNEAGAATINMSNNLTLSYLGLTWTGPGGGALIFNTNDNQIVCSGQVWWGSNGVGGTITLNMGSSSISCASFCATALNDATSTQTLNMGSSQWTCTGVWTNQSNHTIVPGTSVVTFSGAAAQTVTTAGKSFANVTITNSHAAGVTFVGAMISTGTFTFDSSGSAILVVFADTPAANVWTTVAQAGVNAVTITSTTPATQFDVALTNPVPMLSYINVTDSNLTNGTIGVRDGTSTNGGNNSPNWLFVNPFSSSRLKSTTGIAIGVGVGI